MRVTHRQRYALRLRMGSQPRMTYRHVGFALGVGAERARQICAKAVWLILKTGSSDKDYLEAVKWTQEYKTKQPMRNVFMVSQ